MHEKSILLVSLLLQAYFKECLCTHSVLTCYIKILVLINMLYLSLLPIPPFNCPFHLVVFVDPPMIGKICFTLISQIIGISNISAVAHNYSVMSQIISLLTSQLKIAIILCSSFLKTFFTINGTEMS
jgi:hypothetical protein